MTVSASAVVLMCILPQVANPQPQPAPHFDVASIKPCSGDERPVATARGGGGAAPSGSARLRMQCETVRNLILTAYGAYANGRRNAPPLPPVEGGPSWVDSERYTIEAVGEDRADGFTMRGPMLQALLESRFQLKLRHELREAPGYALTVARGGPKLQPHQEGNCLDLGLVKSFTNGPPPPPPPGGLVDGCGLNRRGKRNPPNMTFDVPGVTLDYFTKTFLGLAFPDRAVVNKTGIKGLFDIRLEFTPNETQSAATVTPDGGAPPVAVSPTGPSIFTTLQQQLGLKLESARGAREFLVIDHVERPSEN